MKIYLEIEGENPRTGLADVATISATIDDASIRGVHDPLRFIMKEVEQHVTELLNTPGVLHD